MDYVTNAQMNTYPNWMDNANRIIDSNWGILLYIIAISIAVFFYLKLDFSTAKNSLFSMFSFTSSTSTTIDTTISKTGFDKVKDQCPKWIFGITGACLLIAFGL